ncbi:MAG: hypothetical protein IKD75_04035 [Prevotella sp.]|nr:hypothetical protein [Prevotella sp.]
MKKEELMIGDWVYNTHNRQNEQVAEIGSGLVMLEYNDLYEYDEIEPIPLTSELLEKKGFERVPQPGCVNPYHWMLEKYEEETEGLLYRIKAYNTLFRGMYVSIDNPSDCETINFGKQIEHVHELQHAFRLCNISIDL